MPKISVFIKKVWSIFTNIVNNVNKNDNDESIQNKENKSLIITNKIVNLSKFKTAQIVALYMNNEDEVITKYIIEECFNQNKKICIPKVIGPHEMNFFYITKNEKLELSKFNILEPNNYNLVLKEDIELMIVPGICFDQKGGRIGYGKGFYDNYLKDISPYKIGICFKEQLLINELIKLSANDIKMNEIITN